MHQTNATRILFLIFKEFLSERKKNVTNDPFIFESDRMWCGGHKQVGLFLQTCPTEEK
jgi:hypothetical protein